MYAFQLLNKTLPLILCRLKFSSNQPHLLNGIEMQKISGKISIRNILRIIELLENFNLPHFLHKNKTFIYNFIKTSY